MEPFDYFEEFSSCEYLFLEELIEHGMNGLNVFGESAPSDMTGHNLQLRLNVQATLVVD